MELYPYYGGDDSRVFVRLSSVSQSPSATSIRKIYAAKVSLHRIYLLYSVKGLPAYGCSPHKYHLMSLTMRPKVVIFDVPLGGYKRTKSQYLEPTTIWWIVTTVILDVTLQVSWCMHLFVLNMRPDDCRSAWKCQLPCRHSFDAPETTLVSDIVIK